MGEETSGRLGGLASCNFPESTRRILHIDRLTACASGRSAAAPYAVHPLRVRRVSVRGQCVCTPMIAMVGSPQRPRRLQQISHPPWLLERSNGSRLQFLLSFPLTDAVRHAIILLLAMVLAASQPPLQCGMLVA